MHEAESFKIVIQVQQRDDGGLRVWSDDVPGLVLSNRDPQKVLADIKPAIEAILSQHLGCEVEAYALGRPPALSAPEPTADRRRRARGGRMLDGLFVQRNRVEYAAIACA